MNRVLIILFLACAGLSACTKGYDEAAVVRAQATVDDRIIQDYMAAHSLGVSAKRIDTTGVFYIIEAPGTGNALYTNSTRVTVNYEGRILTTGAVFTKNNGFSPTFVLGEVIKGWQLGIPQIKKGGRVRLLIPSRYAYGAFDQPDIGLPANTVVDFEIQLLDVTN
ncbi:peptidylprolyl isomerase [Inquilinus sp. KBS0705]|nr:peptidylprolyl isomerase [Inquilinus sp. KBS0705]